MTLSGPHALQLCHDLPGKGLSWSSTLLLDPVKLLFMMSDTERQEKKQTTAPTFCHSLAI